MGDFQSWAYFDHGLAFYMALRFYIQYTLRSLRIMIVWGL